MRNSLNDFVKSLKAKGYQVYGSHSRYYKDYKLGKVSYVLMPNAEAKILGALPTALARGGVSRVHIVTPDGKEYVGESRCCMSDNFNRKLGFTNALRRAYQVMQEDLA